MNWEVEAEKVCSVEEMSPHDRAFLFLSSAKAGSAFQAPKPIKEMWEILRRNYNEKMKDRRLWKNISRPFSSGWLSVFSYPHPAPVQHSWPPVSSPQASFLHLCYKIKWIFTYIYKHQFEEVIRKCDGQWKVFYLKLVNFKQWAIWKIRGWELTLRMWRMQQCRWSSHSRACCTLWSSSCQQKPLRIQLPSQWGWCRVEEWVHRRHSPEPPQVLPLCVAWYQPLHVARTG